MKPTSQKAWLVLLGGLLVIAWVASISRAPSSSDEITTKAPTPKRKSIGTEGSLSNGEALKIAVAADEEAFNEWVKALVANDKLGQAGMLAAGEVFGVPQNTRVLVIDRGFTKTRVRILEGDFIGRSGWVPYEWVQ